MSKRVYIRNRRASCHPDRKHRAKGLCNNCYARSRYALGAQRRASALRSSREYKWRRAGLGVTQTDYNHLAALQKGLCAICGEPPRGGRALALDHCHITGKVRGLLCAFCNRALGLFRDRQDLLRKASSYLHDTAIL